MFDQEFFAFELEFLAFEFEVGEFFDVGEEFWEKRGGGLGAHEFEGAFAEHLIHDALEARGMIDAGLFLDVDQDIQRRTGHGDEVFGPPRIAEAGDSFEADLKSEPFGSWCGDATP